ncbi:MAG: spore germination protein [Eubacteriaceae bacterium]|nr:spore germination protein [Eubacteriaceae bacterium]
MADREITHHEFVACGVALALGSVLQMGIASSLLGNEAWIAVALGWILFAPCIGIYGALAKKRPSQSYFSMLTDAFGKYIGKTIAFIYLIFFSIVMGLNVYQTSVMINTLYIMRSPTFAIACLFLLCSAYASFKGVASYARAIVLPAIIASASVITIFFVVIAVGRPEFLLPVFQRSANAYLSASLASFTVAYGDSFIMMMFLPYIAKKINISKAFFDISIYIFALLLIISIREILMLGPVLEYFDNPTFETLKAISIGGQPARLESLFIVIYNTMSFIKDGLFFIGILYGFAEVFEIKAKSRFAFSLALLLAVFSSTIDEGYERIGYYSVNTAPALWAFMYVALPFLLLLMPIKKQKAETSA